MLCEVCHERDAAVTLTKIENNEVKVQRLCERCAAEQGVEMQSAVSKHPLGDFLQAVQQQATTAAADSIRCTFCGTTMADFRTTGRWGCPRCYSAFEPGIRELLRRVPGSSRHVGRAYQPPRDDAVDQTAVLGELKEKLRRAIENEQFELAADLRDRIRVLE